MKFFNIVVISLGILVSGCAVTKDGVRISTGQGPTQADADDFLKRNDIPNPIAKSAANGSQTIVKEAGKEIAKNSVKQILQESVNELKGKAIVVIIGNVMALNDFSARQVAARYDLYEKNMKASKLPVKFSREWYTANVVGSVNVKVGGIPGVYSQMYMAELDKRMKEEINFPSSLSTFMFQISSDLVVAEDDGEKGLRVTNVLCSEKKSDFSECSSKYAKGMFQSKNGFEIDTNLRVIENGAKIDIVTYQKL